MTNLHRSPALLLLSVGIFVGFFSNYLVSAFPNNGLGTNSRILIIPRIGINRSSKDNGFPERGAEYATHRPYKTDFDLLRVSERSQELEMPLLRNNELDGGRDTEYYLAMDPTLRSRRKRQVSQAQMFFGLPSNANSNVNVMGPHTSAFAVPSSASSAIFIPSTFSPSSPSTVSSMPAQFLGALNRNDLAILNYYQQQLAPPQAPLQQQVMFQGPLPNQRQRPELQGIHTKYPYPYPPTDVNAQQPGGVVPESVGPEEINAGITTDYPADGTTLFPVPMEEQQDTNLNFPDSPFLQQQQPPVGQPSTSNPTGGPSSQAPSAPPSTSSEPPSPPRPGQNEQMANAPQQQQGQQLNQALKNQVMEKEDIIRQLNQQLEQANLQVASYEQENAVYKEYKEQYARAEEANIKLRERVLQLENTNQHLQDIQGQLQQVNSEHKQQINSLKDTQRELIAQVEDYQSKMVPLSKEVQRHRKEIEDFLIRIRKLGEESETCQEQVKLYQLKINYIQAQQHRQQPGSPASPPIPVQTQAKKQQPQQKLPQSPSPVLVAHQDDDELDPELMRMDKEIAALQKNAAELAAVIKNLPQPPQGIIAEDANAPGSKKENEFPGEAVQVSQVRNQQEQNSGDSARAPSASRTIPAWEKPAGF